MKIIIVGSVAAGTSVAAKARRNDESAEIIVYEKGPDISYSICGIPYYLGNEVEDLSELIPRDKKWFEARYNVKMNINHEVTAIDPVNQTIRVTDLSNGAEVEETFDKLVLATGANVTIPGYVDSQMKNIFPVRTMEDTRHIDAFIQEADPKQAVIIGGGYIGMEIAEQFTHRGIKSIIIQRGSHIMSSFDPEISFRVQEHLQLNGVEVYTNEEVTAIHQDDSHLVHAVETKSGHRFNADIVILATGVRPNVTLAQQAGLQLGPTGAIQVDKHMRTSHENIYAVGDVAESYSSITRKPFYHPLGSTANKMGRIAGDVITGGELEFHGVLGTGIFRVFELAVGTTGLTEQAARNEGFDVEVLYNLKPARAEYLNGKELLIKAIADRKSGRLLGAQAIGTEGVDKRLDVLATALHFKANVEDLFHLDLAYAPPFSTTKDPVMYTGMALHNAISRNLPLLSPAELVGKEDDYQIIDTRSRKQYEASHVQGAQHISLKDLREKASTLDPKKRTVTYCNKGTTGNAAQNILINLGFEKVYNLSGGNKNYQVYRRYLNSSNT
ncbi:MULTISPECIES: FAD-dependent oxidoreductase [Paenibacillus]|uniref:FAD-dependent oxidoreductase n=1 Tax=Paenibacillus tianjinensis TaxID=2810347 RepID=A0ABX7LHE3_9BACL|nr:MULTISPECIES: FAD-dependent oxidoreductase [Paenibacillus]MDF9839673.1 NADPH-dependent 2,4-dienoyl-CoA reductase/sulfur reductase-like enzyme/rhodanese-related sulfurtransferase [Paenibacillus sp. PastF-2]MDF9846253.1 NADPH-dependent 2,4-dienoyl-CoA reductase/sulfur reductase-like enzyme/rhodanese-related sulfurtransferase [Paenibacillus sp. PastM-2]MDF9852826.1 NADPH-dependent 2,4-dienoyl-CoA reductase/sulfur reductase-like enzyme/rhodanese-related sulfurtransferase [Paenibacillus sp. PastF-